MLYICIYHLRKISDKMIMYKRKSGWTHSRIVAIYRSCRFLPLLVPIGYFPETEFWLSWSSSLNFTLSSLTYIPLTIWQGEVNLSGLKGVMLEAIFPYSKDHLFWQGKSIRNSFYWKIALILSWNAVEMSPLDNIHFDDW